MRSSRRFVRVLATVVAAFASMLVVTALTNLALVAADTRRFPPPGTMVDVDGTMIHVYSEGGGRRQVVLLSGWASPCPVVDFKPLIQALSPDFTVTVVEYPGYGWSGPTGAPRSASTIVEETRSALKAASIPPPYVLVPHSLSGIYALQYAVAYPAEVEAVVNLDTSFPELNRFSAPASTSRLRSLLRGSGLLRVMAAINPGIIGYPRDIFSKGDIDLLVRMACRNLDNPTVRRESDAIYANRASLLGLSYPAAIPVVTILASDSVGAAKKAFGGMDWLLQHRIQLEGNVAGALYVLEGGHNLYWRHGSEVAAIIKKTVGD